jgi:hypothetical protein
LGFGEIGGGGQQEGALGGGGAVGDDAGDEAHGRDGGDVLVFGEGVDVFLGERGGADRAGRAATAAFEVNFARGDGDGVGVDDAGDLVLDGFFDAGADGQDGDYGRHADDDAEHGEEAAELGVAQGDEGHLEVFEEHHDLVLSRMAFSRAG